MKIAEGPARAIDLAVIGLGRAFVLSRAAIKGHSGFRLVAAADPRDDARAAFLHEFGGTAVASVEELMRDPGIEAVYVASPHQLHRDHVLAALAAGKHVLVEKPMALDSAECEDMTRAAVAAKRVLMVGPSHGCDAPVRRAAEIVAKGSLGRPRQIVAFNYTDFVWRPRRPEELDDALGGGVVMSQAAHHVDIVRALAGCDPERIVAQTGAWLAKRPCTGAYAALLTFPGGLVAQLTYSGYGRFDASELMDGFGEFGAARTVQSGAARARVAGLSSEDEATLKLARGYGGEVPGDAPPVANEHFGFVLVSCESGDIRITPQGLWIHTDGEARFEPIPPPPFAQWHAFDAFAAAIDGRHPPRQDGRWGAATVRICEALIRSARDDREVSIEPKGLTA